MEVYRSKGSLVGMNGRDHETLPTESTGLTACLGRSLNATLVSVEVAINSRPIVQAEGEAGVLTPALFLIGEKLMAVPTGPEPGKIGSLTKEFRMRQKLADDLWRRWQREYLMMRSFHEVREQQPHTKPRTGDVTLLQEDVRPRHMWRKALIKQLIEGRDGRI
jgi:hypothetical protein